MATISAHWLRTSLAVWTLLQRRLLLKTTSLANAGVRATRPHPRHPLTRKRGERVQQGPPVAPTPDAPSRANPWRVQHGPPVAPLVHKPGGGKDAPWKWKPVSDPSDPRLCNPWVAGTGSGGYRYGSASCDPWVTCANPYGSYRFESPKSILPVCNTRMFSILRSGLMTSATRTMCC
jgi:hypothetical protein